MSSAPTAPAPAPTTPANPGAAAQAQLPATPPALVLFTQAAKRRSTNHIPHVRLVENGNIYLSKPAVDLLELRDGSRLVIGYRPEAPREWFVMPVSSTDPDALLVKVRAGESQAKAAQQAKAQGEDITQTYGGYLNCKGLTDAFYQCLGREPFSQAWRIATTPETIHLPQYPHHTRAWPIITAAPIR